jgi:glycerate kinase
MLQALGLRLLDGAVRPVAFGGGRLGEIRRVDRSMSLEDALREAETLLERRAEQIVLTFMAGRKRL